MRIIVIVLLSLLSACSSITKNMELATENSPHTEVIIYRPWAFSAGANGMLVGINGKYFSSLNNKQFIKIKINSGDYNFHVKANGSQDFNLKVTLSPNDKVCLQSNINLSSAGVAIIPLVANMISWFQLKEVACPTEQFFDEYSQVKKS